MGRERVQLLFVRLAGRYRGGCCRFRGDDRAGHSRGADRPTDEVVSDSARRPGGKPDRCAASQRPARSTSKRSSTPSVPGSSLPPGGKIRALCSNTADSGGLQIDPGAVANTYGSWAEVSSSLPADVAAIWLDLGNIQNTALTAQAPNFRLDIGIGGAGSEVTIFGPIRFGSDAAAQFGPLPSVWWPLSIPAGTRVAARPGRAHRRHRPEVRPHRPRTHDLTRRDPPP